MSTSDRPSDGTTPQAPPPLAVSHQPRAAGSGKGSGEPLAALVPLDWERDPGAVPMLVTLTRSAVCQCGTPFEQRKLSGRYLASLRTGARAAIERECPGGWVPLNCPPCEHVQLGADARRDDELDAALTRAMRRPPAASEDARYELAEREGLRLV